MKVPKCCLIYYISLLRKCITGNSAPYICMSANVPQGSVLHNFIAPGPGYQGKYYNSAWLHLEPDILLNPPPSSKSHSALTQHIN